MTLINGMRLTEPMVEHGAGLRASRVVEFKRLDESIFSQEDGLALWAYRSVRSTKYGFRASGVRTGASADRAETGLLPRFLSSVLKRPSQEVRRELASGERFSAVSAPGQSTGLPRKPQETCHSARRSVRRRARLVWELAEGVRPDTNGPSQIFARLRRCPEGMREPKRKLA